jgi:hypothetical protein
MDPTEVDAALEQFVNKVNDRYQVYIASPAQGRGIDFPSDVDIEKNGGVYVTIANLPQHYLQYG